jgi:F-type H+-transporting ATPase subunit delta
MARRPSAKRYAQAVFALALEKDELDRWGEDLRLIRRALEFTEFRAILEHARVSLAEKARVIGEVLKEVNPLARNLLCILAARGVVELAPEIEEHYQRLLDAHRGRERATVLSAVPLEPKERERLSSLLTDMVRKEVILDARVEPSILGGLVVKVGDKLIDGSTRSKLEELRKRLTSDSARPV